MTSIYWLIILAVLLIIEIATLGLTTIWFAGGALAAFIVSLACNSFALEFSVGLIVSFILLIYTRPLAIKHFNIGRIKTNYESIIGRDGKVTQVIDNINESGQVALGGQTWTARSSLDDEIIPEQTIVTVKSIQGVKLIVEVKMED